MEEQGASARPHSRYYMQKMLDRSGKASGNVERSSTAEVFPEPVPVVHSATPVVQEPDESFGEKSANVVPKPAPANCATEDSLPTRTQVSSVDVGKVPQMLPADFLRELAMKGESLPAGMSVYEPEKFAWMGNLDEAKPSSQKPSGEKEGLLEARFDMEGNILHDDARNISVKVGLHHHSEDPEKPGYTLDEIQILLQSSVQSQKLWALSTLTAIIHKAKHSIYDEYLDCSVIQKIVEENHLLPLRFLLDSDSLPLISAALLGLCAFLVNDADEFLTDELLMWDKDPFVFELAPEVDSSEKPPEEDDLTDVQLVKTDVIKGLLRTSLFRRFDYILSVYSNELDVVSLSCIFKIVIRIVRHSEIIAQLVVDDKALMERLMCQTLTRRTPVIQMKLLRILTSVLGPLSYQWANGLHDMSAGWISTLRNDIRDITTRDMVTESLNLLIVLANYGCCPRGVLSVADVFPQVLFSAGVKGWGTGKGTLWDIGCCSRILSLLTLCLLIEERGASVISDDLAKSVLQVILHGFMGKETAENVFMTPVAKLQASYLRFLGEYIRLRRNGYIELSKTLSAPLSKIAGNLMDISQFELDSNTPVEMSKTDPNAMRSYGLIVHGGRTVHPVFDSAKNLCLCIQAIRFLNSAAQYSNVTSSLSRIINDQLAQVASYSRKTDDFWASYYVRFMLEIVRLGGRAFKDGSDVSCKKLYTAGLHIVPYLSQNHQIELKEILTEVLFSVPLLRRIEWKSRVSFSPDRCKDFIGCFDDILTGDMQISGQIFNDLRPLGFADSVEKSLMLPSRDATIFTRSWMFECFSYVLSWAKTDGQLKQFSVDSIVRGYFSWIAAFIRVMCDAEYRILRLSEIYLSLNEYFAEGGFYRDLHISKCMAMIFCSLVCSKKDDFKLRPTQLWKGKPFDDFYTALLDEYAATSYADPTYTMYVLIPTHQHQNAAFRKQFWGPEKQTWSIIRIHHLDLCYPVDMHLEPAETDVNLLNQYFIALLTLKVNEKRNPLVFLITVHHLNRFINRPSSEISAKFRNRVLQFLAVNKNVPLAQQLLRYKGASSKRPEALEMYESVPDHIEDQLLYLDKNSAL